MVATAFAVILASSDVREVLIIARRSFGSSTLHDFSQLQHKIGSRAKLAYYVIAKNKINCEHLVESLRREDFGLLRYISSPMSFKNAVKKSNSRLAFFIYGQANRRPLSDDAKMKV